MAAYDELTATPNEPAHRWAWSQLQQYTFGRIEADTVEADDVAPCFEELAELYTSVKSEQGRVVASESVGSWSRSYDAASSSTARRVGQIINQWLGSIPGLLYRGLE